MLSGQAIHSTEEKKDERNEPSTLSKLFKYFKSAAGLSSNSKPMPVCDNGICYRPAPSISQPQISQPQNVFVQNTITPATSSSFTNSTTLEVCSAQPTVLPDKSILQDPNYLSFLLAIPEELITESAKSFKCKEEKIYYANQAMRAVAMNQLADISLEKTLLVPAANFILTRLLSCRYDAPSSAKLSSTIIFFGMTAYFGPVAIAKGFAIGISGTAVAKGCLFAAKKLKNKIEEELDSYAYASGFMF